MEPADFQRQGNGMSRILGALAFALAATVSGMVVAQARFPLAALGESGEIPTLAPVLAKASPSVVAIRAENGAPDQQEAAARTRRASRTASHESENRAGSGVIIDAAQGLIITNNHVITRASDLTVILVRGRRFKATVVGSDPETDLAVIKVPADELTAVSVSDSNRLQIGDFVVALGVPYPIGRTMTAGIVSGLHRSNIGIARAEDFIQTDAAIYPGDSGGALVNLRGELVGINTGYVGASDTNSGVGFAIPSNLAQRVFEEILAHGAVRRGMLGISYQDPTPGMIRDMKLAIPRPVINKIDKGSPAERAGLRKGDAVTAVDGIPVREADALQRRLGLVWLGEKFELSVVRDGQPIVVQATMDETARAKAK
jgi:serine protease Do/serine protease DegQ